MITTIPDRDLNRLKEKRGEEILTQYLENFERGYYEEGEESEDAEDVVCTKVKIPAAQVSALRGLQGAVFAGGHRVITIPVGNVILPEEEVRERPRFYGGPTVEPVLRIAYPVAVYEKAMPAAFPASLWLYDALDLERTGRRDRALDIIYTEIDKLLRRGEFDICNRLLELLDVNNLSPSLLIAFLTITLPAHERLPARGEFYSRVEKYFVNFANRAKLLSGLKGPQTYGPRFY